jgi:hypothetical protein
MSETYWPHTLHILLNLEKQDSPVFPVTDIIQILDILVPKPDVPVFTDYFSTASFWGLSIKAFPLPPLKAAGSTNENTHPTSLCELSPTPLNEVCVICEKFKLGLSEILFVST